MTNASTSTSATDLDHADKLWKAADTLRGQVDAAEYKHVVLGLLFLKYISDAFEARRQELREELEADGIPADQIEALLESRDEYAARFPGALIIAEDLQDDPAIVSPEGAGFGSQWDAAFVHPVRAAVITPRDEERSVAAIREALEHRYRSDAFARVVYSESHDEVANGKARVLEEISPGDPGGWAAQKRSTLAAALVMTSPGIPMVFQGQEFLQGEWFRDEAPLDWDLSEEYHGILRMYRDLIRLRRNLHGHTRGLSGHHLNVHHLNEDSNVLAFHRWAEGGQGDDVVVIVNLSNTRLDGYRIGFPTLGLWRLRLNSDWARYGDEFHNTPGFDVVAENFSYDGLAHSATLAVGPYTVLIYSQGVE